MRYKKNLIAFVRRKNGENVSELCGEISVNKYDINGSSSLFFNIVTKMRQKIKLNVHRMKPRNAVVFGG